MARYRKIDVCMWGDDKFRALSAPPPNARDCWIHLLTNRETTSIPGVYRAYPEALARDLGWTTEGYLKAFREVFAKGMAKADWEAGLVFIPGAIKRNSPESPNVIRGWRESWSELPECALKHEAYRHLKAFVEGLHEGYAKAFREALPEGSADPLANQEQEQEQEQEKEFAPAAPAPTPRRARKAAPEPELPGCTVTRAQFTAAIAAASGGRYRDTPPSAGGMFKLDAPRARPDALALAARIGAWLAAGGDGFKAQLDGRNIGTDLEAWIAHAEAWDGKPITRAAPPAAAAQPTRNIPTVTEWERERDRKAGLA